MAKNIHPESINRQITEGQKVTVAKHVTKIPVEVTPRVTSQSSELTVSFDHGSLTVTDGSADFEETIEVSKHAVPGSTLTATVDFLINNRHVDGFQQSVTVNVPKHATSLWASNGVSTYGQPITIQATLTDDTLQRPIAGVPVNLSWNGDHGVSRTTDANYSAALRIARRQL